LKGYQNFTSPKGKHNNTFYTGVKLNCAALRRSGISFNCIISKKLLLLFGQSMLHSAFKDIVNNDAITINLQVPMK